jgi:hypothetical protein
MATQTVSLSHQDGNRSVVLYTRTTEWPSFVDRSLSAALKRNFTPRYCFCRQRLGAAAPAVDWRRPRLSPHRLGHRMGGAPVGRALRANARIERSRRLGCGAVKTAGITCAWLVIIPSFSCASFAVQPTNRLSDSPHVLPRPR